MLKKFGKSDIEKLRSHLIVPLAVSDILHHDLTVEPDMQYGLHMALSEIDPDSALLTIALSAIDIAEKNVLYAPIASALLKEASDIVKEYGPIWLHHHINGPMTQETYYDLLQTVPEDLEALADLLDALCADLSCVGDATPVLSNLLSIQARAHMEITEFILSETPLTDELGIEFCLDEDTLEESSDAAMMHQMEKDKLTGDNIILFPFGTTS